MFKRHKKEIFYKQFFIQCNLSILAKRYQYRYRGQTTISRFVYLKRFFFYYCGTNHVKYHINFPLKIIIPSNEES